MAYNPYYFSDSDSDSEDAVDEEYHSDVEMETEQGNEEETTSGSGDMSGAAYSSANSRVTPVSEVSTSVVSFPAFSERPSNLSAGVEESTDSASQRSFSPANSVISLSESIRTHVYKEEYGRSLNNYCDIYRLPADEEEWDRMDRQHALISRVMGEKYPPPLTSILQSTTPREKKVLDLGSGNGSWIKEVARDFPFCEAVAVDLVPISESRDIPPNLRSEVDDINLGLQHFYNKFDVVHCRLISSGIEDYQLLIERISRVLRPGGLISLEEFDYTIYDKKRNRIPVSIHEPLGPPWCARYMGYIHEAVRISGGDMDAATHLYTWISSHEAFENIDYRDIWLPVVPGTDTDHDEIVYSTLSNNVIIFLKAGRPLLLGTGVSEETFDILEQNTIKEIRHSDESQFTRLQCIYAIRKHGVFLNDI